MNPKTPLFFAFTQKYNGRVNRITTAAKICAAFDPAKSAPPSNMYETTALWDTGATRSVITSETVDRLGLVPVGTATLVHAGGTSQSHTYLVTILLPNKVGIPGVIVNECVSIGNDCGAIIGMDIIGNSDLSITNVNGQTCMTFRIPSIKTIDYVVEANRITYANVGRNSPCPCGKVDASGKPVKFKMCCGKDL